MGKLLGGTLAGLFLNVLLVDALKIPRHATPLCMDNVTMADYDFIIAGAGIAGLTLADRLTEDKNTNVLVIEAGPFDRGEDGVLVPGVYSPWQYVWPGLVSEPQTALNNQSFSILCGRVVGGGSTVNAMVFLRGASQNYDSWVALGNAGWGWKDMLPFFKKSESLTKPDPGFATTHNISWENSARGFSGPVHYSYPNYDYPSSGNWWSAAVSTGLKPAKDPNGGNNVGVFWFPTAVDGNTRTRSDSRVSHYDRVKDARPNYHILAEYTVSRVLFDKRRAIGVEYIPTVGGESLQAFASKEVILAAGALHTPQILQLSGIGPKQLLDSLGIPVVEDLPGVGQNFQDQATIEVLYNMTNNMFPNAGSLDSNTTYDTEQRALYDSAKKGAYTIVRTLSTNLAGSSFSLAAPSSYRSLLAAALKRDASSSLPPNTDPSVLAGYIAQRKLILASLADPSQSMTSLHWNTAGQATLYQLRPLSRGLVNINTTDPLTNPIIDFRTATDPTDLAQSIAIVRKHREIMSAPDMKVLGPVELSPFGSSVQTDQELEAVIRKATNPSAGHQCCTAAMLPRALGGVLDHHMLVYGVEGLRVVDISYWPMQISAAPTATMYATGEKIADVIKKKYGLAEYSSQD